MDTLNAIAGSKNSESAQMLKGPQPEASARSEKTLRWLLLVCAVALVCIIAARHIRLGEFDFYVDEAQHAVTGLFVADALHDLPLRHPVQYAYTYYAQYPAVAILHWPPLFYFFEGVSFILFGATAASARLIVLCFAVLLLYEWFLLVEELQDSYTAAICTAVLGLLPTVLLFEKTVMLEIPSLALGVATIRYWIRYLHKGSKRSLYVFGLWLSAALLCKQTSVYLLVFCVLTLLVTRKWEYLFRRDVLVVAVMVMVLAGSFLLPMLLLQGHAMANDLGSRQMSGWGRISFYVRVLPRAFSPALFVLSILGLLLASRWNKSRHTLLMVCWIVAGYLTFTFFGQKESRFAIYWFPPLVYFAIGLLTQFFRIPKLRLAMRTLAGLLVVGMGLSAWGTERPYISGYKDVASHLVKTYHAGIVLFDGRVPGNFVFYMRALDPKRHFLTLRKSLYADDIRPGKNSEELLHSKEELLDLFKRDGIRFVVVSENAPLRFHDQLALRQELQSDNFQLLGRFPILSNELAWQGENLLLYENKQWTPPTEKELRIRMLTLPHDIVVPFGQFVADGQ